jgi:hypothetical protein
MSVPFLIPTEQFSRCIAASKKVRWDIESDVIRGRRCDRASKFLPDGLTLASRLDFLSADEKVYFSQGSTITGQCRSRIEDDIGSPVALCFKRNRIPTTRNHCVTCGAQIPTLSHRVAPLGHRRRA